MDSNTSIGNVTQFVLKMTDAIGNTTETAFSKKFIANANANYAAVDTGMRALASLSTSTYTDTICITNISVNEVMAG